MPSHRATPPALGRSTPRRHHGFVNENISGRLRSVCLIPRANHRFLLRYPGPPEGRLRNRHETRAGLRWTRRHRRAFCAGERCLAAVDGAGAGGGCFRPPTRRSSRQRRRRRRRPPARDEAQNQPPHTGAAAAAAAAAGEREERPLSRRALIPLKLGCDCTARTRRPAAVSPDGIFPRLPRPPRQARKPSGRRNASGELI